MKTVFIPGRGICPDKSGCPHCRDREPRAILGRDGEIAHVRGALGMLYIQDRRFNAGIPINY